MLLVLLLLLIFEIGVVESGIRNQEDQTTPLIFCLFFHFVHLFFCLFADISKEKWEKMTAANGWNAVELRDNRYNHIVHMVSAANGAEDFYSTEVREIVAEYEHRAERNSFVSFSHTFLPHSFISIRFNSI